MSEGNFDLRSCNTNCNELKELMIKDKKYVEHGCDLEKVLGYKYNTKQDTIQISNSKINCNVNTKRGVLAKISKVFDPLSLCLLVSLNGKLLMQGCLLFPGIIDPSANKHPSQLDPRV